MSTDSVDFFHSSCYNMDMMIEKLLEKYRRFAADRGATCDICKKEVFDYPNERICPACRKTLASYDGARCPVCGRKAVSNGVCLTCKAKRPRFEKGISALVYTELAARTVNRFKSGERYLSYFFAERMAEAFNADLGASFDRENAVIVSVPLTEATEKRRGYNQSAELAERLSELLRIPYLKNGLIKTRETDSQKTLNREEREANVRGAYRVHERKKCRDKVVLLVDDILTTGTTGSEIAGLLLSAGASKVILIVAAATVEKK